MQALTQKLHPADQTQLQSRAALNSPVRESFLAPTRATLVRESFLAPTPATIPSRTSSPIRHSLFAIRHSNRGLRCGLTMIELLVVITIIAILISMVAVASTSLIARARTNSTLSLLTVVTQAVEDFKREKPGVINASQPGPAGTILRYLKRYGPYPPDELEVFATGLPGHAPPNRSFAPGNAQIVPPPPYSDMKFYAAQPEFEHRDLAAMIVAIETLSESAASILQQIPDRNRVAGYVDPNTGAPGQFLDRDGDGSFGANDHQVRYIVDDWGIPLGYLAQRDYSTAAGATNTRGSNHQDWNQTSTDLVRLNGGAPVIFSWGADGKEQLTKDAMGDDGLASVIGDWMDPASPQQLNHPMNADNVYANQALKEKLQTAPQQ
jgi:prepilin-type N-terminal cleavage/methylation domain-containing protein